VRRPTILGRLTGDARHAERQAEIERYVTGVARADFADRHPDARSGPIVALVAAYEEEQTIAAVLEAIPPEVDGLAVTPLVVVDGGDDATFELAVAAGALCVRLPVNLGHGVALRLGYQLADELGARFVVTLDADGQNDPSEIGDLVRPVIAGDADFVIGSRRLGVDETSDLVRRAGVVVYSAVVNRLIGQRLTDTSSGYRALRIEVLRDVVLEQDQYQTAELIISAGRRGWRLAERPTVWHPRAAGSSKKGSNLFFGVRYGMVIVATWRRERRLAAQPRVAQPPADRPQATS
jgi:glycosyltransferase involved in cell wall biosynthesis